MAAIITSPGDLVTSHAVTVQGFLEQASKKNRLAAEYIEEGRRLTRRLERIGNINDLMEIPEIQGDLMFAACLSKKAKNHLSEQELKSILQKVLENIASDPGNSWREEIVYRYLLIRGDSFGGSMRNLTGASAGKRFSEALISVLDEKSIQYSVKRSASNPGKISALEWEGRKLVFDRTSPITHKNIDVILLDTSTKRASLKERLATGDDYVTCGELKGGIDPAGADEHWKTANTALNRIRSALSAASPKLFFIGAAIEDAMAREIFEQLQNGQLDQAANFTIPEQVKHLVAWLVEL